MSSLPSENDIRERIKAIRSLYLQLTLYGFINFICVMIWAVSGGGYFWPIWILVGWGSALGIQAVWLGLFPALNDLLPFMRPDWEEAQVRKMMKQTKTKGMEEESVPAKLPAPRSGGVKKK